MLYAATKSLVLALFRAPLGAPEPPAGGHAAVEVFRASPRYLTYKLLALAAGTLLVAALAGLLLLIGALEEPGVALAGAALLLCAAPVVALAYFLIHLDYDLRYYVVTDRSARVREGAWTVRELTLSYANVQNLRVTQGPLQRLLRISDLAIHAAGGGSRAEGPAAGGHQLVLRGIENAPAVRDRIQSYLESRRSGAGLGDPDDLALEAAEGGAARPALRAGPATLAELGALRDAAGALRRAAEGCRRG